MSEQPVIIPSASDTELPTGALKKNSQIFADISQQFIERAKPLKIRTFYETEKLHGHLVQITNFSSLCNT